MRAVGALALTLLTMMPACAVSGDPPGEETTLAQTGDAPREDIFARGSVDVVVFALPYPRATAAALLPHALELGDVSSLGIDPDHYPIMFVVGTQLGVHAEGMGLLSATYAEAVVFVPQVRLKHDADCVEGRRESFLFSPAMYVDDLRPWLGTSGYEYPKQLETLRVSPLSFGVGEPSRELLSVNYRSVAPLSAGGEQNRMRVADLASAPIIGMEAEGKSYVWSFFDWQLRSAQVSSMGVSGVVRGALGDGDNVPFVFHKAGLNEELTGAFRLRTSWTLSKARRCHLR